MKKAEATGSNRSVQGTFLTTDPVPCFLGGGAHLGVLLRFRATSRVCLREGCSFFRTECFSYSIFSPHRTVTCVLWHFHAHLSKPTLAFPKSLQSGGAGEESSVAATAPSPFPERLGFLCCG